MENQAEVNKITDEVIDVYAKELLEALNDGYGKREAKDLAMSVLKKKFGIDGNLPIREWGLLGSAAAVVYQKSDSQSTKSNLHDEINNVGKTEPAALHLENRINYMEVFRNFCDAGFLPKNLEPLIGIRKQKQMTAYKALLAKEGFVFEETIYGWIVIEKQNLKKIEKQKELDSLKKQLKELEDEINFQEA